MSEPDEGREGSEKSDDDDQARDKDFIPDADAGPTPGAKYSKDEDDHGRQDYGP